MSKGKCSVAVISSSGKAFTTKRGASRLVDQGMAEKIDDFTVRMFEGDHRYQCVAASTAGPQLEVIAPSPFALCWLNSQAAVLRFPGNGHTAVTGIAA